MNWKFIRIIDTCIGIPLLLANSFTRRLPGRHSASPPGAVRRLLLIKFWGIGNIFMLLPAIEALREAYPDATIDFLTLDSNRDALTVVGAVDNVVTITTASLSRFLTSWRRAVTLLKRNRYDISIDFEQFARFSALVSGQIGARERIGFSTKGQHRSRLFSRVVPYDNTVHVTRSFFSLAAAAGAAPCHPPAESTLRERNDLRKRGREFLLAKGVRPEDLCVVVHIGTSENFRERRWLPERYAALADLLMAEYRTRVIFTGLAEEAFLISETVGYLRQPRAAIDLSGQLPFTRYLSLIAAADMVISADTAAVHLASALDTPVAGLYGPNTPHLYGPWGEKGLAVYEGFECSPCITNFNAKLHTCRHPAGKGACMHAIEVADVYTAIRRHYLDPAAPFRLAKLGGG